MPSRPASRPALFGWLLFDWACQPVFTLVGTFVFAPYFATAVVGDPVRGQALWGYATAAAGLVLALVSPVLGSIADQTGARKPWIAGAGALLIAAASGLWIATPGAGPGTIFLVLALYALLTVAAETAIVFNNSMMPHLVPPERLGRLSGTGWAVGYAGGLVSLVIVLGFLAASPETGLTQFGLPPAFGLDPAAREGDRATGPLSALWFLVFVLPLFLLTPDQPATGRPWGDAVRAGWRELGRTLSTLRGDAAGRNLGRFLVANMVYQDGLVALFAFGGIYGAGVFGWGALELGLFGIGLTITGTAGALAGGRLDDRLGPRAVVLGSLAILVLVCLGILSLGRASLLFGLFPVPGPAPGDGLFAAWPERAFLGLGLVIGAVAGPLQAASRSLLARMAPAGREAGCFGLFSLSGKLTSFAAPLLVAVATDLTGAQAAGLAVLVVFFVAGGALLVGVRAPRAAPPG